MMLEQDGCCGELLHGDKEIINTYNAEINDLNNVRAMQEEAFSLIMKLTDKPILDVLERMKIVC